ITGATQGLLEHEVKPLVEAFLRERGLELSNEKTVITHIADGCDFLGQHIRKYNGKLLIKPSAKSIKSLLRKVRAVIKGNKSASAGKYSNLWTTPSFNRCGDGPSDDTRIRASGG